MRLLFSGISAIEIAEGAIELAFFDQVARPIVEIVGAVVGALASANATTPPATPSAMPPLTPPTTVASFGSRWHRA